MGTCPLCTEESGEGHGPGTETPAHAHVISQFQVVLDSKRPQYSALHKGNVSVGLVMIPDLSLVGITQDRPSPRPRVSIGDGGQEPAIPSKNNVNVEGPPGRVQCGSSSRIIRKVLENVVPGQGPCLSPLCL